MRETINTYYYDDLSLEIDDNTDRVINQFSIVKR
nr:MAG TPA: hypothetical protein [Caudoviricetes sp.]